VATIALMQERTIRRAEELTEQLQGALTSRVVIEQAKSAVAALRGISTDDAFDLLRTRARSNQRRLVDVAQAVLNTAAKAILDLRIRAPVALWAQRCGLRQELASPI